MAAAATIIMMSAAKACTDCVSAPLTTTEIFVLVAGMICFIVILWIGRK